MKMPVTVIALTVISPAAFAGKSCDELKTEIAAKIDANHVAGYSLELVTADQVGERKVVGSCEGAPRKSSTNERAVRRPRQARPPTVPIRSNG